MVMVLPTPGISSTDGGVGRSWSADYGIQDQLAQGMVEMKAKGMSSDQESNLGLLPGASRFPSIPTPWSAPERPCCLSEYPPRATPAQGPDKTGSPAICCFPKSDTPALAFHVHVDSGAILCLLVDFGDGSGGEMRLCNMTETTAMTAYHQYKKEGVYKLQAVICGFHGAEVELGPYYVEIGHETVSVLLNSSSVHKDEVIVFAGSNLRQKSTVVMHHFPSISSYNVSFISMSQVGDSQTWPSVTVWYKMQSVSVYTNGTVFAANTDITFVAVTKETTTLEFVWHFENHPPVRTTSRSVRRRLSIPQWYRVTVKASNGISSVVSEPHLIRVQKRIVTNRLVSPASALVNTSVAFECRINFGTDVTYRWDFGDSTISLGGSFASHVYSREGEFTVEVYTFNSVSSAVLRKHVFIVHKPCQPPPVKNMGLAKVQIWRSQPLRLGVTFEAAVLCDISQGLSYTWRILDSKGSLVTLPAAINTHRQTLVLPSFALEYGNYTAIAKVHIQGSVVHSSYRVGVEVRAKVPVSIISEGTHLFIPRATSLPFVLKGSQSYDPDNPGAALRYLWTCTVASSPGWPCFDDSTPYQLDAGAPIVSFPAKWLSECCDQFLVTLKVSSGGRNSSEAQVVLSTRSDSSFRLVHISWINFKDIRVNWNEELSLLSTCEGCGETPGLSYSWELFLVNATEKHRIEAFSVTESMVGDHHIPAASGTVFSGEPSEDGTPGPELGFLDSPRTSPSEGTWPRPSSFPTLDDFEAFYSDIQEALPSRGRQPGSSSSLPGSEPSMSAEESPHDGDNLLGPFLTPSRSAPTLMTDWPKAQINPTVFQGYTSSGITGPAVTIKPYSLSSGETYVLQASVASRHGLLGKAQLYLTVNRAPQDVTCQVQPHHGLEAHTIFSVFCMSGQPDFHYEFSYQIGNASKRTLYHGRDTHYYFALPAGEPVDNYRVMVSTEITDGEGSKAQPCAVAVTVMPRYHGDDCSGEDLYNSSLKNLSTLQLMGSHTEIRNYVAMITRILRRLAKENRSASCGQWTQIQDALISSVCNFILVDQEELIDSVLMLRDLISFPNKLSFISAVHILKYTQTLLAQGQFSGRLEGGNELSLELVLLITGVWEASRQEKLRNEDYLQEEGMKVISGVLLDRLSLSHDCQIYMSTGQIEFRTLLHHKIQSSVQSLGSVLVHLPGDLTRHSPVGEETQNLCHISQLVFFKRSPYPTGRIPGQVGGLVRLTLYSCSSRRPIRRGRLETPVTVEFGEEDSPDNKRNMMMTFVLLRNKVNSHQFLGLSENPQESLQIQIEFSNVTRRAFPVMLLVRFSEKPSPSEFLVKQIYFWDEQIVQIYIPAIPRQGANIGYLSLLDADYDRRPPNKYFAKSVNYTVHFRWLRCLFWDKREWRSENLSPQSGTSPGKVNCSYHRLAPFSILRRKLNATFEVSDISKLQSHPQNLLPSVFIVLFMILYGFLVIKARCVDCHEKKKTGHIFLQKDTPPYHQLYAIVIDTGFRSPAHFTSKAFIILCGKNGLTETRELCCPEKPLFERNSRHTFILSASDQLGPLQKICLWHDSRGCSPSWFVSHVMVKELHSGQGWFFPAQCWLDASRCDGRVERELTCLRQGLGFRKLFYSKFTEYLEDFHIWLSVYSRPSSSGYLHTPRLAVSFFLLCVYACLTALVTSGGHEQSLPDVGSTEVTFRSFFLGLLCSILVSPGAQLLSLLFRLSKGATGCPQTMPGQPLRRPCVEAPHGNVYQNQKLHPVADPLGLPASSILSGSDIAWREAASGSSAACPTFDLEACRAGHHETAMNEKSHHGSLHPQAPSSGFEGLMYRWSRACLPWLSSVSWFICGSASLACGVGTGFLGYRFVSVQCMQWLYLLFLSVVCCVFITQPLMICCMALGFAWKRKDDDQFFTESLRAATRSLDLDLEEGYGAHIPLSPSCCMPECAEEAEKVLAARQRQRQQRWARPPSMSQLRVTRERLRRKSRTQTAVRDISMCVFMPLLLLFIIHGTFSPDEYSLNQAIRREFIRNGRHSLGSLRSTDDWWDWSMTTLLDGLHSRGPSAAGGPGAQPGALGGKCYLIGASVMKQTKVSPSRTHKPSRTFLALIEDSVPKWSPEVGVIEDRNVTPSGPRACRARKEGCVHSLGKTRAEAYEAFTALRASRWIDSSTKVVSVHFTLFNPPAQLFSSVTLNTEVLPTGGLVPSFLVESFSIFTSDSTPHYHLLLAKLVFLVLNLTHLCFQLSRMVEKGILSYWRSPRTWLELSVVGVALAYYTASGYLATLAGDVADQFRQGLGLVFVDLSVMALWNQRARWLRGLLSFLWMLKCVHVLCLLNKMAPCSSVTRLFLSRGFVPALMGVLLLAAHSHLLQFLLFTWALPPGTSTESFPWRFHFLGRSQKDSIYSLSKSDQQVMACYCMVFLLLMTTLSFRMLSASLVTFFRKRKSVQSKSLVTLKDVAAYVWGKVLTLAGLDSANLEEAEVAVDHNYYLDEFSSLLDELLIKINGLYDSLELPILEKQSRRTVAARAEGSPS
uniref:Polycystin-1-like protein 1 n=1 Tax=Castor canadensis TaxID=51338 RepID=A0A8B7UM20_CASCN|nr:polycystic kidney disease protein 1-like 1 [Castor canadensis]